MAQSLDFSRSYSGEVKVIVCDDCIKDGILIESEGFCMGCFKYKCEHCSKKHDDFFKDCIGHVLQDKDSMPQSLTEAIIKDICVTSCDLHSNKVNEYSSSSCDVLECTNGKMPDHRQCVEVEQIPNTDKLTTDKSEVSTMINVISKSSLPVPRLDDMIYIAITNEANKPAVTGLEMFHGRFIVVADRLNKAVKVIDIRNKDVSAELENETEVWSVTKVDEDTAAIGMNKSIQLFSVSMNGLLSKNIVIDSNVVCFGSDFSDGKFYLACGSSLRIIDMQGTELNKIETDSEGKRLFACCVYEAVDEDHETIYASDFDKNTVTSMTLEGKVKAIYKDRDLMNPCGIAVDKAGNVYVCSEGTGSIHHLSANCTKLQVFKGIQGRCITCINKNKLVVGFDGRVKNYDLMFKDI